MTRTPASGLSRLRAMEQSSQAGAGRKIWRRQTPRAAAATPYDRPPTVAAAASAFQRPGGEGNGECGGWVSRLVDPASRLIAVCAACLFSTVFHKRPASTPSPAPLETRVSAPPGRDAEQKDDLPELAHIDPICGVSSPPDLAMSTDYSRESQSSSLRSRVVLDKKEETSNTCYDRRSGVPLIPESNEFGNENPGLPYVTPRLHRRSAIRRMSRSPFFKGPICGVSSHADFPKQYMSACYSREPQSSSFWSRVFLGNKAKAGNTCYDRRSGVPLVPESNEFGNENHGLPLNGYVTSGLRGRSDICTMSRSPFLKGLSYSNHMNMSPFSSPHAAGRQDPICGVSSPAYLAKQYTSARHSREPQSSSLWSREFLGNKAESSNTCYDRRSGVPLVPESNEFGNENPGLPLNGYMTSRLCGRSAICRMARSPFFKVLKRRGADFENELGSIGPIRRIRQKSNMMSSFRDARASPRGNFIPTRKIGSDSSLQESPSSKRLLLGNGQFVRTAETHKKDKDGKSSSDNIPPVPPQAKKNAEKIFEQLNTIPEEKQSGRQSVSGNPCQSMSKKPVWEDNGPNRLSDPSSSLQLEDLGGVIRPHDNDLNGSSLNKTKLKKDGSSKVPSYTGNKDIESDHVAVSDKPPISGNSVSTTISHKPGFRMAILEDSYEFDDDQETPVPSKNSSIETEVKIIEQKIDSKIKEQTVQPNTFKQKVKSNLSLEKLVSSPVGEHPITSSPKDISSSGLFSLKDPEKKTIPHVSADNSTDLTFPHVPPGDRPETTVSVPPLDSNKDDKQTSTSSFMFGLKPPRASDLETSTSACVKAEEDMGRARYRHRRHNLHSLAEGASQVQEK